VSDNAYRGHRFPRCHLECLLVLLPVCSEFRDVEEAMASRGVLVSYETIRRRCDKFGHLFVAGLRKRRAQTGDKWHLDEVFLNINGVRH
jgi:putative transposase